MQQHLHGASANMATFTSPEKLFVFLGLHSKVSWPIRGSMCGCTFAGQASLR